MTFVEAIQQDKTILVLIGLALLFLWFQILSPYFELNKDVQTLCLQSDAENLSYDFTEAVLPKDLRSKPVDDTNFNTDELIDEFEKQSAFIKANKELQQLGARIHRVSKFCEKHRMEMVTVNE